MKPGKVPLDISPRIGSDSDFCCSYCVDNLALRNDFCCSYSVDNLALRITTHFILILSPITMIIFRLTMFFVFFLFRCYVFTGSIESLAVIICEILDTE